MKIALTAIAITASLLIGAESAQAKGCVTGAAVGGVAGHVAGHHGLIGAAAGCAIGSHRAKVKDEKAAAAQRQKSVEQATPAAPASTGPVKP